jgi:hypothetical protein
MQNERRKQTSETTNINNLKIISNDNTQTSVSPKLGVD